MNSVRCFLPWLCLAIFAFAGAAGAAPVTSVRTPLAGDWVPASSGDEIGYYNSNLRAFYLCKNRFATGRLSCVEYQVHDSGEGVALMGRWAPGDGAARPALYNPSSGTLQVYEYSDCLPVQCLAAGGLKHQWTYQLGITGATPVVGDWDGSGLDSIALIRPLMSGAAAEKGQVVFFSDGFTGSSSFTAWNLNLTGLTPISGDWPDTRHVGDSLGFYDTAGHVALLLDGLHSVRSAPMPVIAQGLRVFGLAEVTGVGGIGLYYPPPPDCPGADCHRVSLWHLPMDTNGLATQMVSFPHLDSRFPDDPGDPTP